MGKRNLENLYIKSHRYGNERYRDGWDRIFGRVDTRTVVDIEPDSDRTVEVDYPDALVLGHFC